MGRLALPSNNRRAPTARFPLTQQKATAMWGRRRTLCAGCGMSSPDADRGNEPVFRLGNDVILEEEMNPTIRFSMLLAAACAGRPYFNAAVCALVSGRLNLDVPISVGVGLALGMAVFETSHHATRAYFTSALVLLALLLVGGTLEQALRRRARRATVDFATLRVGTVMKFVSNAELAEMPATSTQPGDLVLVRPGERVAVDGV